MSKVNVETITPLLEIRSAIFLEQYRLGLWWSMHGDRGENSGQPMHDLYLVQNLQQCARHGFFDGQHDADLSHIGFLLGMIHGGALDPQTGGIEQGFTTFFPMSDTKTKRGYRAGREFVFFEAYPDQQRLTDGTLIERLRESITEMTDWGDSEETWRFSIGCVLGELSCQLFPETEGERQHWQKVKERIEAQIAKENEPVVLSFQNL